MIAQLRGTLAYKAADRVVIDAHGVGYEVFIPFSTYYELGAEGETVQLHICTHVREDALSLYGFLTLEEKKLFTQLIQLSGIGPRLGVTILSGLPVQEFVQAVLQGDIPRLCRMPGVGKKTAERIVLELKDRISTLFPECEPGVAAASNGRLQRDLVSALVNLGYPAPAAESAVKKACREAGEQERFDLLLKAALKQISG